MKFNEFDNRTILIIGLIIIALIGMILNVKELPLAVASGLVGYLSKDSNVEINHGDNTNTYHNTTNDTEVNGECKKNIE